MPAPIAGAKISKTTLQSPETFEDMMKRRHKTQVEKFIPADDYPPLLPAARRAQAMRMLRSRETVERANRVISLKKTELRGAVLEYVDLIDAAARAKDWNLVFDLAHEIRGMAATAGLLATGKIANGLCRYLDALALFGAEPDRSVATLHLDAIVRSARTEDDAARHGAAVADQLQSLVDRKLAEVKEAATSC
jgi:chemotaxis protein histidine kinase CheA